MAIDLRMIRDMSTPPRQAKKINLNYLGLMCKSAMIKLPLTIIAIIISCMGSLKAEQTLPAYKGHVNDYANVLSAAQIKQLDEILFAYEDSTSSQIAVVLEPSANKFFKITCCVLFPASSWLVPNDGGGSWH